MIFGSLPPVLPVGFEVPRLPELPDEVRTELILRPGVVVRHVITAIQQPTQQSPFFPRLKNDRLFTQRVDISDQHIADVPHRHL